MKANEILTLAIERGIYLFVESGKLKYKATKDSLDNKLKALLKEHKAELITLLNESEFNTENDNKGKPIYASEEGSGQLSFGQKRLWLIDKINNGSPEYNIAMSFKVEGNFDLTIAEQALNKIIERHQILRTIYAEKDADIFQVVVEDKNVSIKVYDLVDIGESEQTSKIKEILRAEQEKSFDLSSDLMLRASFIRLNNTNNSNGVVVFTLHHIASDGWSIEVLIKEFSAFYEGILNGRSEFLLPLKFQYIDYSRWQNSRLEKEILERQINYWSRQLSDIPLEHSIPLDFPRLSTREYQGATIYTHLSKTSSEQLIQFANTNDVTLFVLCHALLGLVLSSHGNNHDIVIGTPVANRSRTELEPMIGFFTNTLVLRTDTKFEHFVDYLEHVKKVNLDALSNQDVPFEQLVELNSDSRSNSHSPLFQIMFSMKTAQSKELVLPGVKFTPIAYQDVAAKFDLDVTVELIEEQIYFRWVYDKDLFKPTRIEAMNKQLHRLIEAITVNGISEIQKFPMLSEEEKFFLVHEVNKTQREFPKQKLIHELFESQAEQTPEQIAVVFEEQQLSYQSLNEQANQLAHYLREQGVGADTLVGLCTERSVAMVVGILGILKAGGAYVPLDPTYPASRLKALIDNAGLQHLVTQTNETLGFDISETCLCVELETTQQQKQLQSYPASNPERTPQQASHNLAYVIYTSGSTGQPKGVMVEHQALVNRVDWMQNTYELSGADKVLQKTPFNFDVSVWEFVWTLGYGGTLIVAKPEGHKDPAYLRDLLFDQEVTLLHFVPSMLSAYLSLSGEFPSSIRDVFCSGEALEVQVAQLFHERAPETRLHNLYGPTEAAIDVSYFASSASDSYRSVPIGRPIQNIDLFVLDRDLNLSPQGVPGELYIGGVGLARGYLNQAELTAERFIEHTLNGDKPVRLYKTGDLVRYLADGNLEFMGRLDDQVKIRGFRIELGEIESTLALNKTVASSLVMAREDEPGQKRLVAYVIGTESVTDEAAFITALRADLQQALPDYMVPSAFVVMNEFPLTANGKIDRKSLPLPDGQLLQGEYVAPATETEQQLTQIWAKLLKLDAQSISSTANFFELGGHSLLAVRLVGEIRTSLKQEFAINEVFTSPTITELANQIDSGSSLLLRPSILPKQREPLEPVFTSFAQQRLWFIDQLQGESAEFNMPAALQVKGDFDLKAAEKSIIEIIRRHETLRTNFETQNKDIVQHIRQDFDFKLKQIDLSHFAESEQKSKVDSILKEDCLKSFDLKQDLMVRASYIKLNKDNQVFDEKDCNGILLFNMHHIASDGWSVNVLLREFKAHYLAIINNKSSLLPELKICYSDYVDWQRNWLVGDVLEQQINYWKTQLDDVPATHSLPLDKPRAESNSRIGAVFTCKLNVETVQKLQQVAADKKLTLFMLLHASFAYVISKHSNNSDVVIGTPVANRLQTELEPLIGLFVNTLVLRTNTGFEDIDSYFQHVKKINIEAQAHQDLPFEQLVEHCNVPRSTLHAPIF